MYQRNRLPAPCVVAASPRPAPAPSPGLRAPRLPRGLSYLWAWKPGPETHGSHGCLPLDARLVTAHLSRTGWEATLHAHLRAPNPSPCCLVTESPALPDTAGSWSVAGTSWVQTGPASLLEAGILKGMGGGSHHVMLLRGWGQGGPLLATPAEERCA